MAFDETLAARVRNLIGSRPDVVEKRMFGGIGFMLDGNMWVAIWKDQLVVRVGPDPYEACLREDHVHEFDVTGRPMIGWVLVHPEGLETESDLNRWLFLSLDFVSSLPPK